VFWQRAAAFALGLVLALLLIELALRLAGSFFFFTQEQRNLSAARQKGAYVIMCVGESTTSDGPDPFPGQMQTVLNERSDGMKFAVINEGMPAINTDYIIRHLQDNLDKYQPDMVVAMMGINDKYVKYYEGVRGSDSKLFNISRTYRFIRLLQKSFLEKLRRQFPLQVSGTPAPDKKISVKKKEKSPLDEQDYLDIVKVNPRDDRAYAELGWLYMRDRKYRQAEKVFRRAVKLNPRNCRAYFGIGLIFKGSGRYAQAEKMLEKSFSLDPNNETACAELGWIYMNVDHDYSRAEELFSSALKRNPKSEKMYLALIELYRQKRDWRSALKYRRLMDKHNLTDGTATEMTRANYLKMQKILEQRNIRLVCVQYPVRSAGPLKRIFEGRDRGVLFVDNEAVFKNAICNAGYNTYFIDMFGGDFGHCTSLGNRLLAENIAGVILKEVFPDERRAR